MNVLSFENLNKLINYKIDWRDGHPNLDFVYNHYNTHTCARLWDGFEVPTSQTNGTLVGRQLISGTVPFMFGYSDYYELSEQISVTDSLTGNVTQHWAIMWCGEMFDAFVESSRWSGARVRFKSVPPDIGSALQLLADTRFTHLWCIGFDIMFKWAPFIRRVPFHCNTDSGNIIARNIYLRREFAFLESFTTHSWGAIWMTLFILSVLVSKLQFLRNGEKAYQMIGLKVTRLISTTLDMSGIMLGQGAP